MNFTNTVITALKAIMTNKGRSFLTMLGVIIGVASVVLLIAIGNGLSAFITEQFNDLGANTINVVPGDILDGENRGFGSREDQIAAFANNKLKYTDVKEIKRLGQPITHVIAMVQGSAKVSFKSNEEAAPIVGTEPDYSIVMNTPAESGRFLTDADNTSKRRVAVIGPELKDRLFGNVDAIGKKIKISGQTFTVVGIAEEKGGGFGGPTFDVYIFIPLETYYNLFDTRQIQQITIKIDSQENLAEAEIMIEDALLKRLKADEFSVFETTEILDVITQVLATLTVALGGIAAISLVVGGIGIMNIMLVSVTERTREIGLRKALGATPSTILLQFLIEACVLSVIGGLIGLALAQGLAILISNFFPAKVTLSAILLAFGVSATTGIIFGVAPARRASKLSPIEALRYE